MNDRAVGNSGRARVLLVDDNAIEARLVIDSIRRHASNPEVLWADSGEHALDILHESPGARISLVLLDIKMPVMDGLETLEKIREMDPTRRIPVVMFSNSNLKSDVEKSYLLGANSYIQKSMDFIEQEEAICIILDFWLLSNQLAV